MSFLFCIYLQPFIPLDDDDRDPTNDNKRDEGVGMEQRDEHEGDHHKVTVTS